MRVCWVLLLLMNVNLAAQAGADISATPQRPSFSTNSSTTARGWFEVEAGLSQDDDHLNSPLLVKLGTTARSELFLGLSPITNSEMGIDDLTLGGRLRFKDGDQTRPSLAAQISVTTSRLNLSGEALYSLLFILSQPFENVGVDFNAGLTLRGDGGEGTLLEILTLGKAFGAGLGGYAELILNHDTGFRDLVAIASIGGSYSQNLRFVFDLALNVSLSNGPFDFQLLGGATYALAQFW